MARRRSSSESSGPKPAVLSPAQMQAAIPKLEKRLAELRELAKVRHVEFSPQLDSMKMRLDDTLVEIFGNDTAEYERYHVYSLYKHGNVALMREPSPAEQAAKFEQGIAQAISKVETAIDRLRERLDDLPLVPPLAAAEDPAPIARTVESRDVFVVHGHDHKALAEVARTLQKLDLRPIVLHEQANRGQTVIEKIEAHSDVAFVVVIMTPDDIGFAESKDAAPRARQNVVLEWGWFAGKLGRQRVCALVVGKLELPSDVLGLVYTEMDGAGAWRLALAKELNAAGISVDLNKLI